MDSRHASDPHEPDDQRFPPPSARSRSTRDDDTEPISFRRSPLPWLALTSLLLPVCLALRGTSNTGDALVDNQMLFREGRDTFRYDTFGDEDFWGGELRLHQAIEGQTLGGVGAGLSPRDALRLGLKVDSEALPDALRNALAAGAIDLDDPANTLTLLKFNAIVGLAGFFDAQQVRLATIGIQCALCHSTVDDSLAPGIGARRDGWANRDLDVGRVIALAPELSPFSRLLHVPESSVRQVLQSWGPGKFDAQLMLDGRAYRPDGRSAAVLIPPAFGLQGVNMQTSTGWGSTTYWTSFAANIVMHGKGTFSDSRLENAEQFPIAAAAGLGHIQSAPIGERVVDRITPKLAALHYYQISLQSPPPPTGSFDELAAARGEEVFETAGCRRCHVEPLFTEPGWNMHSGAQIGIDEFQAERAPTKAYRTAPLKGLWTHVKGGLYHDGRFASLADLVQHYNQFFHMNLGAAEQADLVQYLLSL
jgi:hypothetical protein